MVYRRLWKALLDFRWNLLLSILLVGDVDEVSEILASVAYDQKRLAIVAAEGSIAMDEDPKTG